MDTACSDEHHRCNSDLLYGNKEGLYRGLEAGFARLHRGFAPRALYNNLILDMCGVAGVALADPSASAAVDVLEALWILQHRGQSSCGIATCDTVSAPTFHLHARAGIVSEVYTDPQSSLNKMAGCFGIGHLRYPTAGDEAQANIQPLVSNLPEPLLLAHNGNLINGPTIIKYLKQHGYPLSRTASDSELLLGVLTLSFRQQQVVRSRGGGIWQRFLDAVSLVYKHCEGSFACVAALPGVGILAFRDAYGIKPLAFGRRLDSRGCWDSMCASESSALDKLGFHNVTDIRPGKWHIF